MSERATAFISGALVFSFLGYVIGTLFTGDAKASTATITNEDVTRVASIVLENQVSLSKRVEALEQNQIVIIQKLKLPVEEKDGKEKGK